MFLPVVIFPSSLFLATLLQRNLAGGFSVIPKVSTSLTVCAFAMLQAIGPVLRIINALVRDRGVYICTAENAGGSSVTSAVVEVERKQLLLFYHAPLHVPLNVELCLLHILLCHIINSYLKVMKFIVMPQISNTHYVYFFLANC